MATLYDVQARHPRVAEPSGEGCCTCAYTPSSVSGCDSPVNLTPHKSKAAVDELFATLRDVAGARRLMKQFKSVHVPGSHAHQASACPFKVGGWREFPKLPCAQNSDHGCPWNSGRRPGKDQVPSRALLGLKALEQMGAPGCHREQSREGHAPVPQPWATACARFTPGPQAKAPHGRLIDAAQVDADR